MHDIQQRSLGGEHPATLRSMRALALPVRVQGRWAEAEALVGAFLDAAGARDVATRHDAYLDEAYR